MCVYKVFLLFYVIISSVNGHTPHHAKENVNRTHHHDQHPGDNIHIRHSGLENFMNKGSDHVDNLLKNEEFIRNKEHIHEHTKDSLLFDPETATPEALDFHFFDTHDTDSNKNLDGLELLHAMMHGLEEQFEDIEDDQDMSEASRTEEVQGIYHKVYGSIDKVLLDDDIDKDGYISLGEFLESRRATGVIRAAHEEHYYNGWLREIDH